MWEILGVLLPIVSGLGWWCYRLLATDSQHQRAYVRAVAEVRKQIRSGHRDGFSQRYEFALKEVQTESQPDACEKLLDCLAGVMGDRTFFRNVLKHETKGLVDEFRTVSNAVSPADADDSPRAARLLSYAVYVEVVHRLRATRLPKLDRKSDKWTDDWQQLRNEVLAPSGGSGKDIPADNPSTVFVNALSTNYLRHFQGREDLVSNVHSFLTEEDGSILTVLGRGGMGKTTLVAKALHALTEHDCGDGKCGVVCLREGIDFESFLTDVKKLASGKQKKAIGRAVAESQASGDLTRLLVAISGILAQTYSRVILYFDALESLLTMGEHHLDGANGAGGRAVAIRDSQLRALIEGWCRNPTTGLKLIFSTRALPDSFESLSPALHHSLIVDDYPLTAVDAQRLLVSLDRPGKFNFDKLDPSIVERLTRSLGGIPRCVERIYTLLNLKPHLTLDDFTTLDGLLESFREGIFDRSIFDSLSPAEHQVLFVLATLQPMYRRSLPEELITEVSDGVDPATADQALRRLVEVRLLTIEETAGGSRLFGCHRIDQEFALDYARSHFAGRSGFDRAVVLTAAADSISAHHNLVDPVRDYESLSDGALLEVELRLAAGDVTRALQLFLAVDIKYLFGWGMYEVVVAYHRRFLDCKADLDDQQLLAVHINLSLALNWSGALEESKQILEAALALASHQKMQLPLARCFIGLADYCNETARSQQALEHALKARSIGQECQDSETIVNALFHLGRAQRALGKTDASVVSFEGALQTARAEKNERDEARILRNIGQSWFQCQRLDLARAYFEDSQAIHRKLNNSGDLSLTLVRLARLEVLQGNTAHSIKLCKKALKLCKETRLLQTQVEARQTLALVTLLHAASHDAAPAGESLSDAGRPEKPGSTVSDKDLIQQSRLILRELEQFSYPRMDQLTHLLRGISDAMDEDLEGAHQAFRRCLEICDLLLARTESYCYASAGKFSAVVALHLTGDCQYGDLASVWRMLDELRSHVPPGLLQFALAIASSLERFDRDGLIRSLRNRLSLASPHAQPAAGATESLVDYFDKTAGHYEERITKAFTPFARRVVEECHVSGSELVLDLGTGTGLLARLLGPHVATVVGVDFVENMILVARREAQLAKLTNCFFHVGNIESLPFDDGCFDLVVSSFGLNAVRSADVFMEARRVLREGGELVFQEWNGQCPHEYDRIIDEIIRRFRASNPNLLVSASQRAMGLMEVWSQLFHRPDRYREELIRCGFHEIQILEDQAVDCALPVVDFLNYKLAWTHYADELDAMGTQRSAECYAELTERFAQCADDNGLVHYRPHLHCVKAMSTGRLLGDSADTPSMRVDLARRRSA